jgi:SAM-dependent methyltransferase
MREVIAALLVKTDFWEDRVSHGMIERAMMPESGSHAASAGAASSEAWRRVWEARRLDPAQGSTLSQLIAADGFDTGFGDVDESSWIAFVRRRANELGIVSGMSVFEVGCGAGAFLYELHRMGCVVGGIDRSATLAGFARLVLPEGRFEVGDASELDTASPADVVVSCGVFPYFPSLGYARTVVERMAVKARRAVAILDVPDRATEDAALRYRRASAGGDAAYARRYEHLHHLYYDRAWMLETLQGCGLVRVRVIDQDLAGYGSAAFRFNARGFKPEG